jgi:hypothetical protein
VKEKADGCHIIKRGNDQITDLKTVKLSVGFAIRSKLPRIIPNRDPMTRKFSIEILRVAESGDDKIINDAIRLGIRR